MPDEPRIKPFSLGPAGRLRPPIPPAAEHDADAPPIWIESTAHRHPDKPPMCLVRWGRWEDYADLHAVRQTAQDLFTAAAIADLVQSLLEMGRDAAYIRNLGSAAVKASGRTAFGHRDTLEIVPSGSTKRTEGVVLIHRGSQSGELSPTEARKIGEDWLAAAEAAENDRLLSEVLATTAGLDAAERAKVFSALNVVRSSIEGPRPA